MQSTKHISWTQLRIRTITNSKQVDECNKKWQWKLTVVNYLRNSSPLEFMCSWNWLASVALSSLWPQIKRFLQKKYNMRLLIPSLSSMSTSRKLEVGLPLFTSIHYFSWWYFLALLAPTAKQPPSLRSALVHI
jgi:hypothetical protein